MIKNENQYKVTKAKLAELEKSLAEYRASNLDKEDRRMRRLHEDAHRSLIEELRAELIEYEELKSGKRKRIVCASLQELPEALIKARIARGFSHKELADLLGMKEQQVQRYEATDYESAALWRLMEVAAVLCVGVEATVTLKKF